MTSSSASRKAKIQAAAPKGGIRSGGKSGKGGSQGGANRIVVAAVVGGVLMVVFIAGIASAWARGLSIDCGCFGHGGTIQASQTQYPQEIARDLGLLACAAWLAVRPQTALSLERFLFPSSMADQHDPEQQRPDRHHERPHA